MGGTCLAVALAAYLLSSGPMQILGTQITVTIEQMIDSGSGEKRQTARIEHSSDGWFLTAYSPLSYACAEDWPGSTALEWYWSLFTKFVPTQTRRKPEHEWDGLAPLLMSPKAMAIEQSLGLGHD